MTLMTNDSLPRFRETKLYDRFLHNEPLPLSEMTSGNFDSASALIDKGQSTVNAMSRMTSPTTPCPGLAHTHSVHIHTLHMLPLDSHSHSQRDRDKTIGAYSTTTPTATAAKSKLACKLKSHSHERDLESQRSPFALPGSPSEQVDDRELGQPEGRAMPALPAMERATSVPSTLPSRSSDLNSL